MSENVELRLERAPEVMARTGFSRSQLSRAVSRGEFPQPVQISTRSVAWRSSDVDQWIRSRPLRGEGAADAAR